VFGADADFKSQRAFYEVFYKLIRRYKYLEKVFGEEQAKLLRFIKFFSPEQKEKLATSIGICLANNLGNPSCLQVLFEDHLIKDGLAMEFAALVFKAWLQEKDMASLSAALKKSGLEGKLLNLLPMNKRNAENFDAYFNDVGLADIAAFQRAKATSDIKKTLQKQLTEMLAEDAPIRDVVTSVEEEVKKIGIPEHEAVALVWNTLMCQVEWNKKEELAVEQAVRHLAKYSPLMAALATNARSELALLQRVQDYCYENTIFLKAFSKILVLYYKTEVLSEDVVLKWYKDAHTQKGKTVFLEQTKKFVEWLKNAEEESEEDDDEED
jgi:hypothetical protein